MQAQPALEGHVTVVRVHAQTVRDLGGDLGAVALQRVTVSPGAIMVSHECPELRKRPELHGGVRSTRSESGRTHSWLPWS